MKELEQELLRQNLVNSKQMNLAKQEAQKCGKTVWTCLVKLGYLSEEDIVIFFAQESGVNYVKLSDYEINEEVLHLLDEDYCRRNLCFPLFKIKDVLYVACSNPLDTVFMDDLSKSSGLNVELLVATRDSIMQAQDLYWGVADNIFEFSELIYKQRPLQGFLPWRESERVEKIIPVTVNLIEDEHLSLSCSFPLEGYTLNISKNGAAIGLEVFLFLPKGTQLSLEFRPEGLLSGAPSLIRAKGEVVYCRMERRQRYLLGILFNEIDELARSSLLKLAAPLTY